MRCQRRRHPESVSRRQHFIHAFLRRQRADFPESLPQDLPCQRLHRAMPHAGHQIHRQHPARRDRPPQMPEQRRIPRPRAENIRLPREINIIDHHIVSLPVRFQKLIGIPDPHIDAHRSEIHMLLRQLHDFPVDVHRGELAIRQEMPQRPERSPARQAKHQQRPRRTGRSQQSGSRDQIPRETREESRLMKRCMDRTRDPELGGQIGFPYLQFLERSPHRGRPSHSSVRLPGIPGLGRKIGDVICIF